jgi:CDP-diacylglycerol--glycerol-3-phosphate 3-phosphatidyltransferase
MTGGAVDKEAPAEEPAEEIDRSWAKANLLTLWRLALAPALLILAYLGLSRAFALVLAASLASDIAGDYRARSGRPPRWSARLDSWVDLCTYASLPLCACWLRPELLHRETATFWAMVAAFAAPAAYGFIKYGTLTSYHARGSVLASYMAGAAAIILFAGGPTWPLRIAAAVLVAAGLQEIAITAALPRPVSMVPSLSAALRMRREQFPDDEE